MRYDAMSVAGLPSTFAVGGVHDRSSTPPLIVAQPASTEASTNTVTSWRRTWPVIGSSAALNLVPKGGLEPPRVAPHAPQTCASASSATSATAGMRREVYPQPLRVANPPAA